jgi:PAS domain
LSFDRAPGYLSPVMEGTSDNRTGISAAEPAASVAPESDLLPGNCHPKLRRLLEYWQSIRPAPDHFPGRQHFEPAAVPDLLPWIWLLDVEREPLRFKYRLLGTEQVLAMGSNPIGRWLDEVHPEFVTHEHYDDYVRLAVSGTPSFRSGLPAFHTDKRFVSLQRLLLPLARDGHAVDLLLGITVYLGPEETARFA